MTNDDAHDEYEQAHRIASRLDLSGFRVDATAVRHAIEAGSTGTEISMMLRAALEEILTRASLEPGLLLSIVSLRAQLDIALNKKAPPS